MGFSTAKSFSEAYSSLVIWRLTAILLIISQMITLIIILRSSDRFIPVQITGEGEAIPLNMSWEDYKAGTRIIEAKGFTRNMFQLLLKKDYRFYQNSINIAQEQMSSELRGSILSTIKEKDVYKDLAKFRNICGVTVIEESIIPQKSENGFQVTFEAIVETANDADIPRRERQIITARLKNTVRSTIHPNGLLLDSFSIKERKPEPYNSNAEQAGTVSAVSPSQENEK